MICAKHNCRGQALRESSGGFCRWHDPERNQGKPVIVLETISDAKRILTAAISELIATKNPSATHISKARAITYMINSFVAIVVEHELEVRVEALKNDSEAYMPGGRYNGQ